MYAQWQVTPYGLVVSWLRFVMFADEIGDERIGWLAPDALSSAGVPLCGPLDARWPFHQGETRDAMRLQSQAARCALDGCDCR